MDSDTRLRALEARMATAERVIAATPTLLRDRVQRLLTLLDEPAPLLQLYGFPITGSSTAAGGALRLDPGAGTFVVTGLSSTVADGTVDIRANGSTYIDGVAVAGSIGAGLVAALTWGSPIVVGAGGLLEARYTSSTIATDTLVVEGYHVSPRAALALQRRGELWMAGLTVGTVSGVSTDVPKEIVMNAVTRLRRWSGSGGDEAVNGLQLRVGSRMVTPAPLLYAAVPSSTAHKPFGADLGGTLLSVGQSIHVRLQDTDTTTLTLIFEGARHYG